MTLFWLLIFGAIGYLALKAYLRHSGARGTKGSKSYELGRGTSSTSSGGIPSWLKERWAMAETERGGAGEMFPAWYFDPMTENQARRLDDDGRKYSVSISKGQASDLIGLGEPADEDDLEVLRFFKQAARGTNESRARHEVALLFQMEANRRAWEDRPATVRQKEFYRFFGMKPGAGLLKRDADKQVVERLKEARTTNDPMGEQWRIYEGILDEFNDADFRDTVDIKKPSISLIRKSIDELLAEGKGWDVLEADLVAERLLETQPNLAR